MTDRLTLLLMIALLAPAGGCDPVSPASVASSGGPAATPSAPTPTPVIDPPGGAQLPPATAQSVAIGADSTPVPADAPNFGGENTLALNVVDDTTFTVELAAPRADFPVALGYSVFVPLPESFFDDPDAFGDNPVGKRMALGSGGALDIEIVGLVNDAAYSSVRKERPPMVFLANRQNDQVSDMTFYVRSALDPAQQTAAIRSAIENIDPNLPIEDLVTMRSGLESTSGREYGAWVQSRNWVRYVLAQPLVDEPGSRVEYSTGTTHLLSAILTKATGKSTWQFAQDTLTRPLGFTLPRWPQDPQGIYFGGNDMLLTPRQMLTFGELYLNGGRARGEQVVPSRWIETSFVPRGYSRISGQRYGYGWWMRELAGHQAYFAWGFGGQYIVIVPSLELVVVTTSASTVAEDRRSHRRTLFELVEDLVIAPVAAAHVAATPRS